MESKKTYIEPKRPHRSFLIFCIEEGGEVQVLMDFETGEWMKLEALGWFELNMGDAIHRIYPAFAAYGVDTENRDFRLDEINGTKPERPRGKRVVIRRRRRS